ncbi:phospholipid-transporting ATPase ABCA3-like [Dermacentor silvarum]|uniref:phospholipid-transporting ATPase ABCA3-like n=1 Tax=Dermacentor silvarum TaxID=543639 RepID=UPI00189B684D|nr:phospholipid-transporting ATPase ABCA3-like [Dermacentor silvarum]
MSRGIDAPRWVPQTLCPVPAFTFPWALVKLLQLHAENAQCERYAQTKHGGFYQLDYFCLALTSNNRFPGAMHFCCEPIDLSSARVSECVHLGVRQAREQFSAFPGSSTPCFSADYTNNATVGVKTLNPFSFHPAGIALEILVMVAEGVLLFALVVYGRVHAVRGVSLAVRPGECVGLLGANGAGKSTTFRILAAVTRPSEGDAYMNQAVLSRNPRQWQSAIGYCPQADGLLDNLTAREYLRLIARLRGVPEAEISPLLDYLLYTFRLSGHAGRRCGTYSGGNRRKLSVAAALIGQPRVVFLDEPSAGVDVMARRDILAALRAISGTCGTAVVMTSHKMEECEAACDRVGIMADGQFHCLGPLRRIMERYGRGCTLAFTVNEVERESRTRIDSVSERNTAREQAAACLQGKARVPVGQKPHVGNHLRQT